ncbi:hypothetical protein BJX61DRAFT_218453 [Aspergillus egyptiacus]|nr:hypothetical protein BJX61DRAFT_218453 [Aspergillus egyptiacus]
MFAGLPIIIRIRRIYCTEQLKSSRSSISRSKSPEFFLFFDFAFPFYPLLNTHHLLPLRDPFDESISEILIKYPKNMRLFNPIDSFLTLDRRQSNYGSESVCAGGGVGAGECTANSSCPGIVYVDQCLHNPGDVCCLKMNCNTARGSGFCMNKDNQTCSGVLVPGDGPPWPCDGPDYILCCVEWENMINETSTSDLPPSSSETESETPTTTMTTTNSLTSTSPVATDAGSDSVSDSPDGGGGGGGGGLTASQKGGIAGGIVGAVVVTSVVFLVVWFLRKRRGRKGEQVADTDEGGDLGAGAGAGTGTGNGAGGGVAAAAVGNGEMTMLASREKLELDAAGGTVLHEMETPGVGKVAGERGWGDAGVNVKTTMAELPGSMAVAEMGVPETRHGK